MILERTIIVGKLDVFRVGEISLPVAGPRYVKLYVLRPETMEFDFVELRVNARTVWHQTTELLLRDAGCVRHNGRLVEIRFDPLDSACVTRIDLQIHAPGTHEKAGSLDVWAEVQTPWSA